MKQVIRVNKSRQVGLYTKFLVLMYEAWEDIPPMSRKDYLDMKTFSAKICRSYSIQRAEAINYLMMFEELGYVSIVKFGKIKLNYVVKNE